MTRRRGTSCGMRTGSLPPVTPSGDTIRLKFAIAEKCPINFFHGFLEDYEIEEVRPDVHDIVHRVPGLLE